MAIQIQDFAGKEQFQSILCDWAIATGLEAMVQATDGKTVYFANADKREPGKADALDHHSQEFGSSSIHEDLLYDGEKVATVFLKNGFEGDSDKGEAALHFFALPFLCSLRQSAVRSISMNSWRSCPPESMRHSLL